MDGLGFLFGLILTNIINPISLLSAIFLLVAIFFNIPLLKRISGSCVLIFPGFYYWLFLYSFLLYYLQVPVEWANILSIVIPLSIVTVLLILIWRKKKNSNSPKFDISC
jgi:hypothetical protein